jgi:putative membrane protein
MRPAHKFMRATMLLACAAFATQAQARSDKSFMKQAAQAGAAEIEAGRLAQTKAKNADVKAFADSMVTDHTQVADELKALAAAKNVKLPEGASVKQAAELKVIDAGDNDKFDERYARHFGVRAHQDTIKLFQDAAREAKDPEVKAWATKTLPGLRHHLEMAQALGVSAKK